MIYAISDEVHQSFIPERGAYITDVMIDTTGVICGILLIIVIMKIITKIKEKNKSNKILTR